MGGVINSISHNTESKKGGRGGGGGGEGRGIGGKEEEKRRNNRNPCGELQSIPLISYFILKKVQRG